MRSKRASLPIVVFVFLTLALTILTLLNFITNVDGTRGEIYSGEEIDECLAREDFLRLYVMTNTLDIWINLSEEDSSFSNFKGASSEVKERFRKEFREAFLDRMDYFDGKKYDSLLSASERDLFLVYLLFLDDKFFLYFCDEVSSEGESFCDEEEQQIFVEGVFDRSLHCGDKEVNVYYKAEIEKRKIL